MIKLYHAIGARSLRCLWACEELGLPYELTLLGMPPRVHNPEFLDINPVGTVPYFQDGDTCMNESGAILEYLAARYDRGQLGVKPDDAAFGAWLNWIHFGEATLSTPLATLFRYAMGVPKEQRLPAVVADYRAIFLDRLGSVEKALADREFLCADRFTMADISVGYALYLARFLRVGSDFGPAVKAYLERLEQRPAFITAQAKGMPPKA